MRDRSPGRRVSGTASHAMSVDFEEWFCDWPEYFTPWRTTAVDATPLMFRADVLLPVMLDALDDSGTSATFFLLGWLARRKPALVREIAARGHEIGVHGYGHGVLNAMSREEVERDVEWAVKTTQDIAGMTPLWYRAPQFSLDVSRLWVLDVLYEHGIRYDSSIVPARRFSGGIPGFPTGASVIQFRGVSLYELPVSVERLFGHDVPVCGGGYFRLAPYPFVRRCIRRRQERGESAAFYIHLSDIDRDEPSPPVHTSLLFRLRANVRRRSCERRLRRLLADFGWQTYSSVMARYRVPGAVAPTWRREQYSVTPLVAATCDVQVTAPS